MPTWASALIELALGALLLYCARILVDLKLELQSLRLALFGEGGANGLLGDVRKLQEKVEDQGERLIRVEQGAA